MDESAPRSGSLQEQRAHRLAKIEALRAQGINPYPVNFPRDHTLGELRARFDSLKPGEETDVDVKVAGRIFNLRDQGGLIFATIQDQSGHFQLFVSRDAIGDDGLHAFAGFDVGDWVGAEGTVMVTNRGEESVRVKRAELLAKGIRPLPNKGRGLRDPETRLRQRYLDLIVDPETRRVFDIRAKAIAAIRRWYHDHGWTEVETPVLQPIPGGASARPFITHYNALELDAYLRIALELYLKRLIVGGYEKVYEIGRVYRNEGVDTRHNPEFTLLESYQAFADYTDVMEQTEQVVAYAAQEALGTTVITIGDQEVDLKPPWRRATMAELVKEVTGLELSASMPVEEARKLAAQAGVDAEASWGAGRIMDEVYDVNVEHTIVGPLFVTDHPREVSPLAKPRPDDPAIVERFEVVVGGRELANAYSELNDPVAQLANFQQEAHAKEEGDTEVGDVDESGDVDLDYIRALEYGMPPTGGLGIGIDRLVMLLAGAGAIRDVILFPTLRPEADLYPHAGAYRSTAPEPPAGDDDGVPERALAPVQLPPREDGKGTTSVKILAWLTGLAGLLTLLSTLPGVHSRLGIVDDDLLGLSGRVAGHVASVVIGLVLILTAFELARGKRTAWIVAVTLLATATAIHILKGPHLLAAAISAALLVALLVTRRRFTARSDPPSLFAAGRFVLIYLAAVLAYGFTALLLQRDRVEPSLTFWGGLETIVLGLIGLDGPYTYESEFFADFFPASLLALGIVGVVILVALLFRPVAQRSSVSPEERERARRLVHRYGWDTLAYFDLRDDKSLFFSSDGQALIAYAYLRGHALASGDPVGAPESIDLVLDEFLAFCRERGWRASFLAAREAELPHYEARGLRSLYLGDEAIIRCDRFTLKGQRMKKVREAVNRVGKQHRFKLMPESEATPELVGQLNAISEAWRGKNPERGFTMSLSQDVAGAVPEILLAVARGTDGKPAGFLRLVPAFGDDPGYSLDLMRHDPDAQNGVTEYLIAQTALALGDRGVRRLSMNFAAWGRLFHAEGERTLRQRFSRWVVGVLNPFFQIESLYSFNEKFDPEWLPRVVVYESEVDLPEVGILYAGVEGFLDIPVLGRYLVPRVVTETAPTAGPVPPQAAAGAV